MNISNTYETRTVIVSCNGVQIEPNFGNNSFQSEPIYPKDFGLEIFEAGQEIKICQKIKQTNQYLFGFRRLQEKCLQINVWIPPNGLPDKFQLIPSRYTFELCDENERKIGKEYPIINTNRTDILERFEQWVNP